jgi:hypothetical protein
MAVEIKVFLFAFEYNFCVCSGPIVLLWLNKRPNVGVCLSAALMDGAYKESQRSSHLLSIGPAILFLFSPPKSLKLSIPLPVNDLFYELYFYKSQSPCCLK